MDLFKYTVLAYLSLWSAVIIYDATALNYIMILYYTILYYYKKRRFVVCRLPVASRGSANVAPCVVLSPSPGLTGPTAANPKVSRRSCVICQRALK